MACWTEGIELKLDRKFELPATKARFGKFGNVFSKSFWSFLSLANEGNNQQVQQVYTRPLLMYIKCCSHNKYV